jgi:hypothetical protein
MSEWPEKLEQIPPELRRIAHGADFFDDDIQSRLKRISNQLKK